MWLGKLTTLYMTPLDWLGHKTSTQTNSKTLNGKNQILTIVVVRQSEEQVIDMFVKNYIGGIIDQSTWSGPFSLVVMMLDYRSRGTWFDPRSLHSTGIFSLQVCSYYICCLVPGLLPSEPKAMQWQWSYKKPGKSSKHLIQMFLCRMEQ